MNRRELIKAAALGVCVAGMPAPVVAREPDLVGTWTSTSELNATSIWLCWRSEDDKWVVEKCKPVTLPANAQAPQAKP